MKINNFQGELTDISAKKKPLMCVLQHRVKQTYSFKERLKDNQCIRKEYKLTDFGCWNISTCAESIAAHITDVCYNIENVKERHQGEAVCGCMCVCVHARFPNSNSLVWLNHAGILDALTHDLASNGTLVGM